MEGFRDRALYYRDIMLPLHERIVNESQLQYNAMQLGPIQLLRAKEQQIETAVAYIDALRDYWLARGDAGQILSGRLPSSNGTQGVQAGGARRMADQEGH
jgi:outer membrane protein, heavy metal efflux system